MASMATGISASVTVAIFLCATILLPGWANAFTVPITPSTRWFVGQGAFASGQRHQLNRGLDHRVPPSAVRGAQVLPPLQVSATDVDTGNDLPEYSQLFKVQIAGLDANILIGFLFVIACFGWASALFPLVLSASVFGMAFDKGRRRYAWSDIVYTQLCSP